MMNEAKKFLPIGAVGVVGATVGGMLTKDRSTIVQVLVGVAITAGIAYGAAKVGLLKV